MKITTPKTLNVPADFRALNKKRDSVAPRFNHTVDNIKIIKYTIRFSIKLALHMQLHPYYVQDTNYTHATAVCPRSVRIQRFCCSSDNSRR